MEEKIKNLEKMVKDMHFMARRSHSASKKEAEQTYSLFWSTHVKPVIDLSKDLAVKYGADLNIAWLSAIFHDIARLDEKEPHDEVGAEIAYKMLLMEGFEAEIAMKVKETILTHRVKRYLPETLEQKILASADAIVHFKAPFYLWFSYISTKSFKEQLETNLRKMDYDYNSKIFFEDERSLVRPEYEVLKKWCEQAGNY